MKTKNLAVVLAATIVVVAIACSKQETAQNEETALGITKTEIRELESENPGLKFDLSKADENVTFESKEDVQKYIDSLRTLYNSYLDTTTRAISVSHSDGPLTELTAPAPCGPGIYSASAGTAGLFSNFSITFSYNTGGVSNATISLTGFHFFSWGNQNSYYTGNSGCSQGDATFGIGALSWTEVYHINWSFNPSNCTFYFSQASGSCGGVL
ncbi:MAG: hypothetical protein ABL876_05585 [Chitinophagaceae bacterium]